LASTADRPSKLVVDFGTAFHFLGIVGFDEKTSIRGFVRLGSRRADRRRQGQTSIIDT
jgi:hypothetical protein